MRLISMTRSRRPGSKQHDRPVHPPFGSRGGVSGLEAIALIWGLCLLALVYLFATARPGWETDEGFFEGEPGGER